MSCWDDVAAAWTRHVRDARDEPWAWNEPALLDLVPPPGRLTVDAGCGEGRFSRRLRSLGHVTLAVDATAALVAAARRADPEGDYRVADVSALPLRDGEADLVVSVNVLQHVGRLDAAVREAGRVLEPGGRLLICVLHPLATSGAFADDGGFVVGDYLRDHERRVPLGEGHVVHFHRPLAAYVNTLAAFGFVVETMREIPAIRRGGQVPLYLHVRASSRPARG